MPGSPRWSCVAMYYSALHLAHAVCATRDVHPDRHSRAIVEFAKTEGIGQDAVTALRQLHRLSETARYLDQHSTHDGWPGPEYSNDPRAAVEQAQAWYEIVRTEAERLVEAAG
ncbi:MAG TPA: HEPN domain-containing protein [Actinobacteria bacterium]|nr:HEPN domain-containing protein [Actinomycetota bacterium]